MTTNEKIASLRQAARDAGGAGVLLMTSDPHSGEYLPAHWNSLSYFSGFTGENSTLVVTMEGSALWCDGRFYVQGDKQLAGTEIACMHAGSAGVPTVAEYLAAHFHEGEMLLLDGSTVPTATVQSYRKALQGVGADLRSADLVSGLWPGRPAIPSTPCYLLSREQAGFTPAEKLNQVRGELKKANVTALAVTNLDAVGWLLNLRAGDLTCTPLAVAYAFVTLDSCTLFLAPGRLSVADEAALADNGVALRGYGEILDFIRSYDNKETVLCAAGSTNYDLYTAMQSNAALTVVDGTDPISALKGVKNPTELANLKECHIQDGVAMVRFAMDLEKAIAEGAALYEQDIEKMLQKRRGEQPDYFDDSFETIAAYGPNAAMMHYHAEGDVNAKIERRGFLLVDCGGQYRCGTTDITRTYPVGPLTQEERRFYTWTLQSHIDIAMATWLEGCTGGELDTLAREPLWRHLINYRCGTGHGVGYISSVHEGPQRLGPHGAVVMKPGMTITDEPGVYETDLVGIRIENELVCVSRGTNQYGGWLAFEPLTLVPIPTAPLLTDELTHDELDWLNAYHKLVYDTLAPRLTGEEKAWLAEATKPLKR
ncbi:MAG: M24 family metallopeptidase [Gemmiger sp.]